MVFNGSTYFLVVVGTVLSAQTQRSGLDAYDFNPAKSVQYALPGSLKEISGLAASPDGRLFAHNDEKGEIVQLNPKNGTIIKRFSLGPVNVSEDFEGIAIVGGMFYMVTSGGIIYECTEGGNKEKVLYRSYETPLSDEYDVEGLCYDPKTQCLLLACKGYSGLANLGSKAVFAYSLVTKKMERSPRFLLSLDELEKRFNDKPFHPSGLESIPSAGSFYILDSRIRSIIEISADGAILGAVKLTNSIHRQPEGITVLPDGTLCISDEGQKQGTLTLYRKRK